MLLKSSIKFYRAFEAKSTKESRININRKKRKKFESENEAAEKARGARQKESKSVAPDV